MKNFLAVAGDHFEMGFQQGEFFRADIKNTFKRLLDFEGIKLIKPKILPTSVFGYLMRREIKKSWLKNIETITPLQYERLRGISKGAQTPIDVLLSIQALESMADDVSLVIEGCFAAAFCPSKIRSNEVVVIKNFDFISEFKDDNLARFSQPKGRFSSFELSYKQITGSHDGLNEHGLCIAYNYGLTTEKMQARLPITLLVQEILENCKTTDEAVNIIKNFRYPNAAILTIADRNSDIVSVEITPEHIGIRKPEKGYLVNTNFFLCDETKKYDIPRSARYSAKAPRGIRGRRIHETNELRYRRAIDIIEDMNKLDENDLIKILCDHANGVGSENTICRHGEFFNTQVSAIFYPRRRKILIAFGYPCSSEFQEYIF